MHAGSSDPVNGIRVTCINFVTPLIETRCWIKIFDLKFIQ
jgi:hypothetical protein